MSEPARILDHLGRVSEPRVIAISGANSSIALPEYAT